MRLDSGGSVLGVTGIEIQQMVGLGFFTIVVSYQEGVAKLHEALILLQLPANTR